MTKRRVSIVRPRSDDILPTGGSALRSDVTVRLTGDDLQRLQDASFEAGDVRVPVLLARARHSLEEGPAGTVHVLAWQHVLWDESRPEVRVLAGLIRVLKGACRFEVKKAEPYQGITRRIPTPRVRFSSARF